MSEAIKSLESTISILEDTLSELQEKYQAIKKESLEKGPHKTFRPGDWVTNGTDIGVVGWVENKALDCPEDRGYMGVSLKNGSRGFSAFCRRNDWALLDRQTLEFYTNPKTLTVQLTGDEIMSLKHDLPRHINSSTAKGKLIDALDKMLPDGGFQPVEPKE